jgi:hypothetical protein
MYAARKDTVQQEIVKGLRKCGYRVIILGRPVDIGVWRPPNFYLLMEIKSPTSTGKRRKRKDQPEQDRFIEENHIPVVTSLEEALKVLC